MTEEYPVLTPVQIEQQLRKLSREIGEAQKDNAELEMSYSKAKAEYEIAMAKTRLRLANETNPVNQKNWTVQDREDIALTENKSLFRAVAMEEAKVKASRGRINQLNTQTDIARSVSTSVRSSMAVDR